MGGHLTNDKTSVQFRRTLQEESQRWQEDNLLTPEQRDAILQRYANVAEPETTSVKEFPLYIRAVLALAVFLVGLAVFLLISFNWEYLSGATKLSIVGSILAAAHIGGFCLRKTGYKYWGDAAFFFAGIMYGVGIWQVGQVFHLPADFPMGMWLWAVGVFLMALVLGSTPLHLLSVALLTIWVTTATPGPLDAKLAGRFHEIVPFFALSLPLFAVLGILAGVLKQNRFALPLYSLLFVFWWILQGVACGLGAHITFHVIAIGLMGLAVSSWYSKGRNSTVMGTVGILLVFGGLLFPSFLWHWGELLYGQLWIRSSNNTGVYMFWAFALPVMDILILLLLAIAGMKRSGMTETDVSPPSLRVAPFRLLLTKTDINILAWVTSIFVLWMGSYCLSLMFGGIGHWRWNMLNDPWALGGMFAVNLLIVWLAIGLIWNGLKRERGGWFWFGVVFFMLWAVIRYVDLFSDVGGMLGAAAIFLFCGLFMFGIVYVWATRRTRIHSEPEGTQGLTPPVQEFAPAWMMAIRDKLTPLWQSERNILMAVIAVALIQFGILGAMIANEMRPHITGTTIRVTTVPVDPRDLFRGDYVILSYEFSNVSLIPGYYNFTSGQTVFVTMAQDGDLWKATGISRTRPKEGVFLRGVYRRNRIEYGIESYFVQEGTGKPIEDAMRWNRREETSVIVELAVAPDGKVSIKTVQVQE